MAISVIDTEVGFGNSYVGNPQSITVNKPNGANDDLMVAVIGDFNISYSRSGWTRVVNQAYTDFLDRRVTVLVKRMTNYAGEPSTFTFTASTYPLGVAIVFSLRGVYFADPGYQVISVGNDYNITRTISGVTTANNNAFVLSIPNWVQYWSNDGGSGQGITSWTSDTGAVTDIYVGAGNEAITASGPYFSGTTYMVGTAVGYNVNAVAGANIDTVWTRYGGGSGPTGSGGGAYGGNSMGIQLAINSEGSGGGGGSCTCNAICDNDCGSNQICTGNAPVCTNSFAFTSVSPNDIILAEHVRELETAINEERTDSFRRWNATPPAYCSADTGIIACQTNDFSSYTFTGGGADDIILADDFEDVKTANNEVVNQSTFGSLVTKNFIDQGTNPLLSRIYADETHPEYDPTEGNLLDLQTKINATRNACICDSHCNCDPSDCGCNGECPSDDYYYYV